MVASRTGGSRSSGSGGCGARSGRGSSCWLQPGIAKWGYGPAWLEFPVFKDN